MISLRNKKYTAFSVYTKITEAYYSSLQISDELKQNVNTFKEPLEVLTKFFLQDRFINAPKRKSTDKLALKVPIPKSKIKSVDFMFMTGELPVKLKSKPLNHMHLLIFFKILEVFILKRVWIEKVEELDLGQFAETAQTVISILPKLLLVAENESEVVRREILQFVFSIVSIYRQFKLNTKPTVDSITAAYTGLPFKKLLSTEFTDKRIGDWLMTLDDKNWDVRHLRLSIYSGNASSPNSGASATRVIEDASAVRLDPELRDSILGFAAHFPNGDHFIYLAKILFENIKDISGTIHSRLFHFTAKGGKARVIANVDWLTQTTLSGLHFFLYRVLSAIPSDFTFDHKKGLPHVWSNADPKDNFYSIDLKAATDRMPRILQKQLIKCVFNKLGFDGEVLSLYWERMMDRTFSTKNSTINNEQPIKYTVGQGMGVFTSWPIMALLHHYIVNCICGIPHHNYALVGDDLVIRGKREDFTKYLSIMSKIGMEVNLNKTVSSEKAPHNVEFARNFIISGIAISPIQYGVLYAWNDQKCSFESFFYAMRNNISSLIVSKVIAAFELHLNLHNLLCIFYFFWKYEIQSGKDILSQLPASLQIPSWVAKMDWARFHAAVTQTHNLSGKPVREGELLSAPLGDQADFMQTFKSDLIVRNKIDASRARDLASRLVYLKFVDDHIGYMALALSNRMFNVELIRYDIDEFGNPLVSKRARNLISELIRHWSPNDDSVAAEP